MKTNKRDRFFNHKMQKIAEELKCEEAKAEKPEVDSPVQEKQMSIPGPDGDVIQAITQGHLNIPEGTVSPVAAVRRMEEIKDNPYPVEDVVPSLPVDWDISSIREVPIG